MKSKRKGAPGIASVEVDVDFDVEFEFELFELEEEEVLFIVSPPLLMTKRERETKMCEREPWNVRRLFPAFAAQRLLSFFFS